ncbi:MAG: DUF2752 domain-containing protein [Cellulosilyticaceae bacterium]
MSIYPSKRIFDILRLSFYACVLLGLLLIDTSTLKQQSICFWYNQKQILCPSCGGTRSFLYFVSGDLLSAYAYHPLFTTTIYPIGLILVLQDTYAILVNWRTDKKTPSLLLYFFNLFDWRQP